MADNQLLPCPMCGGIAHLTKGAATKNVWPHGEFHRAFCTACQLRQLFYRTATEAVDAWNRRAAPPLADDGLPPLPAMEVVGQSEFGDIYGYMPAQMEDVQHEAYEAGRRARGITETLMNPPYGEPDLYARLHTALMDQIAVAKERGKLAAWFDAARGLLEYEGGRHGYGAAAPAQTGTQPAGDSVDTPAFIRLLDAWGSAEAGEPAFEACEALIDHIDTWASRRAAVSTASAPVAEDPVVEANRQMLLERSRVGIAKYGTTLADAGLSREQALRHALEEVLDLSNYLQTLLMEPKP